MYMLRIMHCMQHTPAYMLCPYVAPICGTDMSRHSALPIPTPSHTTPCVYRIHSILSVVLCLPQYPVPGTIATPVRGPYNPRSVAPMPTHAPALHHTQARHARDTRWVAFPTDRSNVLSVSTERTTKATPTLIRMTVHGIRSLPTTQRNPFHSRCVISYIA